MATRKKGNKWRTEFVLQGQRYVRYFDEENQGKSWEAYVRLQVSLGNPLDTSTDSGASKKTTQGNLTLGDCFELACLDWRGSKNERMAVANAEDILSILGKDKPVQSLTQDDMDSLVQQLRKRGGQGKTLTPATINRKMASLSKMLTKAKAKAKGEPVMVSVKLLREPEGRIRYLSYEEERMVLKDLQENEGQVYADFVAVAIDTGARLTELLKYRPRDIVQRSSGTFLTFRGATTKSGKSRSVPLTARAVEILGRYPEGWPKRWTYPHVITHAWARMRERLGMQEDTEFVFHACRHTCATRLLEATGNLVLVKDWLGHSDIRTTTRYTKVVNSALVGAIDALDRSKEKNDERGSASNG